MKVLSQLCYQKPLQLKTKPNTKKTWRQEKQIFEHLEFSPKHVNNMNESHQTVPQQIHF